MNLFDKMLKNKSISKKLAGGVLTLSMGFASVFGLAGCSVKNVNDNVVDDNDDKITEMQQEYSELKNIVNNLKSLIDQLDVDDDIIRAKIAEIEQKIASIDLAVKGNSDKVAATNSKIEEINDIIDDINDIVEDVQDEILALKDRVEDLENDKTAEKLENELAKINARLAAENAISNYYFKTDYRNSEIYSYSSPKGDVVARNVKTDDYAYYNKSAEMTFMSNNGEEIFLHQTNVGLSSTLNALLNDEGFEYNKDASTDNNFVFLKENGEKLSVTINKGSMDSFEYVSENEVITSKQSSKIEYERLFAQCKVYLKSIGLFEDFTKELEESMNYKYVGADAVYDAPEGQQIAEAVMYKEKAAAEIKNNDDASYSLMDDENQYFLSLDENGCQKEFDKYEQGTSNVVQNFKDSTMSEIYCAKDNKISYNEETSTYTIITSLNFEINFTFNDDLSVNCIIKDVEHNITITYTFKQISKEKFTEVYNRVNDMIQTALESENTASL